MMFRVGGGAGRFGRRGGGPVTVSPPTLAALALTNSTIAENSAAGTVVGAILNKWTGSTLSLTVDAGGRFAISGGNLVAGATATDYETATSHSITIRETLAGATNTPRDTVLTINVTDVAEGSSLTISSVPTISGDPVVGQRGFLVHGGYSAVPDSYSVQWYSDGVAIPGETGDNYLYLDIDAGHTITVGEIAHKAGYTDSPLNMSV